VLQKRLETLIEQTSFLLEKQQELHENSQEAFDSILQMISEKLSELQTQNDKSKLDDLRAIQNILEAQRQKSDNEFNQDIDFLQEQLEAIKQIVKVPDEAKAQELLGMIIDPEDELLETEEFKRQIAAEMMTSKNELALMLDDIKNSLQEGDLRELKLMLEAVADEQKEQDLQESDECCSSCQSCSSQTECQGDVDIFSSFADLEKKDKE
jgi:hypothetical protein